MKFTWLTLTIYALATYRLTRLVVDDSITAPIREWLRSHGYVTLEKVDYMGAVVETKIDVRKGIAGHVSAWLFELSTCHWCTSIWTGGLTVAMAYWQGSWWKYVCTALAFSSVAGTIAKKV